MINKLREALAALEHDRWARWQSHLHSKCDECPDGGLYIPPGYVRHLQRQITTKYADLTESERDSDRKEADNTLVVIAKTLDIIARHFSDLAAS